MFYYRTRKCLGQWRQLVFLGLQVVLFLSWRSSTERARQSARKCSRLMPWRAQSIWVIRWDISLCRIWLSLPMQQCSILIDWYDTHLIVLAPYLIFIITCGGWLRAVRPGLWSKRRGVILAWRFPRTPRQLVLKKQWRYSCEALLRRTKSTTVNLCFLSYFTFLIYVFRSSMCFFYVFLHIVLKPPRLLLLARSFSWFVLPHASGLSWPLLQSSLRGTQSSCSANQHP